MWLRTNDGRRLINSQYVAYLYQLNGDGLWAACSPAGVEMGYIRLDVEEMPADDAQGPGDLTPEAEPLESVDLISRDVVIPASDGILAHRVVGHAKGIYVVETQPVIGWRIPTDGIPCPITADGLFDRTPLHCLHFGADSRFLSGDGEWFGTMTDWLTDARRYQRRMEEAGKEKADA